MSVCVPIRTPSVIAEPVGDRRGWKGVPGSAIDPAGLGPAEHTMED